MNTILERYDYPEETRAVLQQENLLPPGLLDRLHEAFPRHSSLHDSTPFLFHERKRYEGIAGFREIVSTLQRNGIELGHLEERELFIHVYRFMATRHALNAIDWANFEQDSMFHVVFPQPGMMRPDVAKAYLAASTEEKKREIVSAYIRETNPHDGKQHLNKPTLRTQSGSLEIVEGSQHKYPQCQLIFDVQTQDCFAFCNYCFRHAQVRGDEDMFVQKDIEQIHDYLKQHREVTDVLITGGDAGYLTADRFERYVTPILTDRDLFHIRTIRLGTRVLSYDPERILARSYDRMLGLFRRLSDSGVQLVFMSHFSTPRELLNPSTVAAVRRLRAHGAVVKSQSPVMKHISLFTNEQGEIDVERSAQNWIDLGNLLAMLSIGFHSMYCARPTGEHHYFTAPLADLDRVFSRVYRSLASINRPSRYITMTSSAGKISLLGTVDVNGEKLFALKFNEGRNMEWMDRVYLARFDPEQNTIEKLAPFDTDQHFFEADLKRIEENLASSVHPGVTPVGAGSQHHDQ